MAKAPENPREIFPQITSDYKNVFGDDLVSIILYGSAAGNTYHPGISDINFLIVLSERGIENLDNAFDVVNKWTKKKVVIPIFLTREYIQGSLDVYPVEYLNFKKSYVVVHGEDVLKELVIEPRWVRLQCEREIKGKLLLLRTGFLATQGKDSLLRDLADRSIRAFTAIFTGLLFLKEQEVPVNPRDVFSTVCDLFNLNKKIFLQILDLKDKKINLRGNQLKELVKDYLMEVRKLALIVDKMED